jgi:drug/metabolite transporter (DMT)-like permease
LTPAFTFIIGVLAFRQPMKVAQGVGLIIGFIGTVLLIIVNSKGQFSLNEYAFLVLIATICYGTNVNLVKTKLSDISFFHLSSVTVAIAGFSALILILISGSSAHLIQNSFEHPWSFGAMFLLGAMGTASSQLIFNNLLSITTPVFASAITYFIPIVAIFWGLLDGETLSFGQLIGMALVVGGVFILNKNK